MNEAPDHPPADDEPPKPLRLGPAFWASLIVGLACVIAGYLFSRLGPVLLPPHP
jgi:hypothetical protein